MQWRFRRGRWRTTTDDLESPRVLSTDLRRSVV